MPLAILAPVKPLLKRPDVVPSRDMPPDRYAVEAIACRFRHQWHRVAVRCYLYSVLRDVDALHRYADPLLYRGKLRRAVARGKAHLEEARREDPELFEGLMADLARMLPAADRDK